MSDVRSRAQSAAIGADSRRAVRRRRHAVPPAPGARADGGRAGAALQPRTGRRRLALRAAGRDAARLPHVREELRALGRTATLARRPAVHRRPLRARPSRRATCGDWSRNGCSTGPLKYLRHVRRRDVVSLVDALGRPRHPARRAVRLSGGRESSMALGLARCVFAATLRRPTRAINAFKPHPRGLLRACELWGLSPAGGSLCRGSSGSRFGRGRRPPACAATSCTVGGGVRTAAGSRIRHGRLHVCLCRLEELAAARSPTA